MPTYHILYNPLAGNGTGLKHSEKLRDILGNDVFMHDITSIANVADFISEIPSDEKIVVSGGDGTVSRFVNAIYGKGFSHEFFYHASGSGNDFARDINLADGELTSLNQYMKRLPSATIKGVDYKFINGIGYGIDGYCCEEGEKQREKSNKPINYTLIAIKGLLFFFKKRKATVTVDGVTKSYKNVWLAPTMHGRYYGGGMMPCPAQIRNNDDSSVSVGVFHCPSKLAILCIFPSIFSGKHTKFKKIVEIVKGHEITVSFDRPTALQIDGETVTNVLSYTVKSNNILNKEKEEEALI